MTFNWILDQRTAPSDRRICIDLEYRLRPKITRFLMEHFERELRGDFSDFCFDVDLIRNEIRFSNQTPIEYIRKVTVAFLKELELELPIKELKS
jgi:hypothetical protein